MPPDPPSARALCARNANATPTWAINLIPDHSKFRGYGSANSDHNNNNDMQCGWGCKLIFQGGAV